MVSPSNILLAHNYYSSGSPSGENRSFELERDLLEVHGHKIFKYLRFSDELNGLPFNGKLKAGASTPWNLFAYRDVKKLIRENQIDLLHVHNFFPLISPAIFYSSRRSCPSVLTLHNYRIYCPAAIPMRKGRACLECLENKDAWRSVFHGCYKDSRIATLPLASMVGLHRLLGTWDRLVDAFIVLSDYQKQLMVKGGLPSEKVHVKPHFFPATLERVSWSERADRCVFVGRLSDEKGARTLLNAWRMWGDAAPELLIIGDGILRPSLEALAEGLPIRFLGQLSSAQTHQEIANSKLLIFPSECIETFGLVILEAMAHGTPVVVSDEGPLPSIVSDGDAGLLFKVRDASNLFQVLQAAWSRPSDLESLGRAGRLVFEQKYTDDRNYQVLMDVYDRATFSFRKSQID